MINQDLINRWDGRSLRDNIGNRAYGLAAMVIGSLAISISDSFTLDGLTLLFITEGAGDLLSGGHHYLSSRLLKYHPKYT